MLSSPGTGTVSGLVRTLQPRGSLNRSAVSSVSVSLPPVKNHDSTGSISTVCRFRRFGGLTRFRITRLADASRFDFGNDQSGLSSTPEKSG
jgi:hypothetical protein